MLWFSKRRSLTGAPAAEATTTTTRPTPAAPASARAAAGPLFEREAELARLLARWQRAREGQGAVVLVAGEAGLGKSSLLNRFVEQATESGTPQKLARASCYPQTGRDEPFWPFADVMNQLVGDEGAGRTGDVVDLVLELAPSWVGLIPIAGDLVGAGLKTAQVVRERTKGSAGPNPEKLLREYSGALASVAQRQPVLVVVDDLHWSDEGSIRLLSHLARTLVDVPALVVCAYRPSDIALEGHPLVGLIDELVRYDGEVTVELPPLTVDGVAGLLRARYPTNRLPETLVADLHERTGGAPLFVIESLRLMENRGELVRDAADGQWVLTRELSDEDLPRNVDAVVRKRIERLPPPLRRALVMASVQGTVFETEVLAAVLGVEETELLDLLEEAEDPHHIVAYLGDVEVGDELTSRFRFTSALFQRNLAESLRGKQLMLAHRRTAAGIERLWRHETDAYAAQLAQHYETGRQWSEAARYWIDAAQRSRRSGETAVGIRRFEHAEALLRKTEAGPSLEQQIEIDEGLSYLYDTDTRFDEAEDRIRHALALNVMDTKLDWRRTTLLQLRLANLTSDKGRHAEALQLLRQLYDELNTDHPQQAVTLEAYRLRAALALALTQMGSDEEGIKLAEDALASLAAIPRTSRDREEIEAWKSVELELRSALAASHFGRGNYQRAITLAEEVLVDAQGLHQLDLQLLVLERLAEMNLAVGSYDAAERYVEEMIVLARSVGNEAGEAVALVVRARILRLNDDPAAALAELDRAQALVADHDWFTGHPQMLAIRAASLIALNRLDEAADLLAAADEVATTSGIAEWAAFVKLIHARLALAQGNPDLAADEAGDAARIFEAEWAYFEQAQALRLEAQAHLTAGNAGTAAHYFTLAAAVFERIGNAAQAGRTRLMALAGDVSR